MRDNRNAGLFAFVYLVILLLATGPTSAATITVDSLADTDFTSCTLREAIIAANTNFSTGACPPGEVGSQDTIRFMVTGTINLISALDSIGSNVTINGPGSNNLIISGGGASVFNVSGSNVIISGLRLTGGNSGSFGGGLWVTGGAIAQGNDLVITANTAADGGGVANGGTLLLVNSSITNNTSSMASLGGGGIYNSGMLTLTNVAISNNNTSNSGGGIYNHSAGSLSIAGSTINNNTVSGGNGGGIYSEGTISSFNANTVGSNTGASSGGGLYSNTDVTVNESTITVNTASGSGGGIFGTGSITVVDSSITSNNATDFGGGVNASSITVTSSLVSGNSTGTAGGGLFAGTYTITNSTISGNSANTAGFGGAAYLGVGDTLTLVNSTVTDNSASLEGGGIWSAGSVTFTNTILNNNTGNNCQGPGAGETWTSNGYNIDSADTCGLNNTGDQVNIDPMLAATLQDNGGPTFTFALLDGSPAIDSADNASCPATDQRGATRPQDGDNNATLICDIGAFEVGDLPVIPTDDEPGSGGCFIATAAHGTAMAEDVRYLRAFRDQYLLPNAWGRKFVNFYYRVSPPLADKLKQHDTLRSIVRGLLKPLVWLSKNMVEPEVYARQTQDHP